MKIDCNFEELRKVPSSLFLGDQLLAIGLAEVSNHKVNFYPDTPKSLAIYPDDKIILKAPEDPQAMILKFSPELREVSSDKIWFFERVS